MPDGRCRCRYNGSVSRILLGPVSAARVRRWLREGHFDVLHVHEPTAPSVSWVANMLADGPIVATFHTANPRSRMLNTFASWFQPSLRETAGPDRGLGGGPPHDRGAPRRGRRADPQRRRGTVLRRGRTAGRVRARTAPRSPSSGASMSRARGWTCCSRRCRRCRNGCRPPGCWSPGRVMSRTSRERLPDVIRSRVRFLGLVSEEDKRRVFHSADVYCAPNTGQESFGIVLLEAMAAGRTRRRERHRRLPPGAGRRSGRAAVPDR